MRTFARWLVAVTVVLAPVSCVVLTGCGNSGGPAQKIEGDGMTEEEGKYEKQMMEQMKKFMESGEQKKAMMNQGGGGQ